MTEKHKIDHPRSCFLRPASDVAGRIQAVIFDLGNVLIDFDHTIAARRIAAFSQKTAQEIFDLFFDSELTGLFEAGRILPEEFFLRIKEALGLKIDYPEFLPIWNEIFFLSQKNRAVYRLARSLKQNYKLALLSNVNILHFDYLRKNFAVFDAFHHIVASYEVGVCKPDPRIYRHTLELLKASSPSRVFYTDDRAELVQKAGELGIRSFVFKDLTQLKVDLESAGINPD